MFIWSFDPIFRFIEDSLIANGDRGKRARFNLAIAEDLTNRKALWEENYEVLEEFSSSEGLWPARNSDRYEPSLCAGACGITSCSRRETASEVGQLQSGDCGKMSAEGTA